MLGDKYVVVDSGGGTVDLTVHQIRLPEGHLKELYKATGEPLPCYVAFPAPTPSPLVHPLQISLSMASIWTVGGRGPFSVFTIGKQTVSKCLPNLPLSLAIKLDRKEWLCF